ncbi:hypothetical protein BIW11_11962, partial [Tropilaelaps mercedesae]
IGRKIAALCDADDAQDTRLGRRIEEPPHPTSPTGAAPHSSFSEEPNALPANERSSTVVRLCFQLTVAGHYAVPVRKPSLGQRNDQINGGSIRLWPPRSSIRSTVAMAEAKKSIGLEPTAHLRVREILDRNETDSGDGDTPLKIIGPALPPHLRPGIENSRLENPDRQRKDEHGLGNDSAGNKPQPSEIIGPVLPPHLRHLAYGDNGQCISKAGPSRGQSGSEDSGSSSDSDSSDGSAVIGPRVELQGGEYDVRKEFEERQRRAEQREGHEPTRESWMTELPRDRTGVRISGTEARTFLKRGGEAPALDDTWTNTPGQGSRSGTKNNDRAQEECLARAQRKRDAEIDAELAEYNSAKRSKALIDMHQESKKVIARKPFNWEEDMRVSMVDTSRAKAMLDRTLLESRFASGKVQKYL